MGETGDDGGATAARGIDWNGPTAQFWVDHDDRYDALLARQGDALLAAADPAPGERVVDIGCGTGSTTLRAARAATLGQVLGIDISRAMIDKARVRAAELNVGNVSFEVADAQTSELRPAGFDLAISRFGVMFFDDHTAAFTNIRRAMRPGGRLVFVCWADQERNEYWTLTADAQAPIQGPVSPSARPASPTGPFALADPGYLQAVLGRAGWAAIDISELREPVFVGHDADDATRFELSDPTTAADLAAADPGAASRAIAALTAAFASRERPDGVWLEAAAWLVRAVAG